MHISPRRAAPKRKVGSLNVKLRRDRFLPSLSGCEATKRHKLIIPATRPQVDPDPQAHEGYEWLYVLSGSLRLVLGAHDLVLHAGEAAEFDTRVPHWFDRAGRQAVELLSLFSAQGERIHVRARPAQDRSLD